MAKTPASKPNCIYVLRCPTTNAVRYVGKAVNLKARLRQHISEARCGNKSHKCDWIRSLLKAGLKPILEAERLLPSEADWKLAERETVAAYLAAGAKLTNGTEGGDGAGPLTDGGRLELSKRAAAMFGTPEGRAMQSARMKALCADPEWRAKRDAAAKATRSTQEYKDRMSARSKARWADPMTRAKSIAARSEVVDRPEYRAKLSAATTRYMADEKVRRILSEKAKAAWADATIRDRQLAAMRAARNKVRP